MKYKHIPQKPYCCVPACLQMVFVRRGINSPSQSEIGYELGMVLPPEVRGRLDVKSHNSSRPPAGWGTQIQKKEYSVGSYFARRGLKLAVNYYPAGWERSPEKFRHFLLENGEQENDVLICFDYSLLYSDSSIQGHASLVSKVEGQEVFLMDPKRNFESARRVAIGKLLEAINSHAGGGVWVIKSLR